MGVCLHVTAASDWAGGIERQHHRSGWQQGLIGCLLHLLHCLATLPCSKWMEQQGLQERLPTQRELRRSGANTLSAKIDSHGGLAGGQGGSLAGSQMLGLDRCV